MTTPVVFAITYAIMIAVSFVVGILMVGVLIRFKRMDPDHLSLFAGDTIAAILVGSMLWLFTIPLLILTGVVKGLLHVARAIANDTKAQPIKTAVDLDVERFDRVA